MKDNRLIKPTFSQTKIPRRNLGTLNLRIKQRLSYGKKRGKFTGKELDPETGLYYYGARYLDPKTSRWLSGDPAMGDYFPVAPVNDDARKHNQNLPGMGGVFNYVNLHVYHYAGNNPVKLVDPDGNLIIMFGFTPGAGAGSGGTDTIGVFVCIPGGGKDVTAGFFNMFEMGSQFGSAASVAGTLIIAPFATATSDLDGFSITLGGSINLSVFGLPKIFSAGIEVGINPTAEGFDAKRRSITITPSFAVGLTNTTKAEGHFFSANTAFKKFSRGEAAQIASNVQSFLVRGDFSGLNDYLLSLIPALPED